MLSNYYQPTPKNFRILGDLFLVLIPAAQIIISGAPNLSDNQKYWWAAACTIGLILGKFLTNLAKGDDSQSTAK